MYDAIEAGRGIYAGGQVPVETLFAHLDLIARLREQRFISRRDMEFFDMNIRRVVGAPGFRDYRNQIETWVAQRALPSGPYDSLFRYIKSEKIDAHLTSD